MKFAYVILAAALVVLVAASGCLSGNENVQVISDGTVLEQSFCSSKGLDTQVTVFHSLECPACQRTVPVLVEIRNQTGAKFEFIDVRSDTARISELGIKPDYIPAVIIKCKVYVGYKSKEEFESLIFG